MRPFQWSQITIVLSLFMLVGCAEVALPVSQEISSPLATFSLPQRIEDLAGTWEYKDTAGEGVITLDAEGRGGYEWEDGRFQTLSLEGRTWTGVWIQEGNDREGGFKLTFSDDGLVAHGNWWYTRIGEDHDPLEPGGTFSMSRPSAQQMAQ